MTIAVPARADVAVVGAGTAGAALAALAAARGLRVVVVERGAIDRAGAHWVNGVPARAFADAGLAAPRGAERLGGGHDFHLVAGWGPRRVVIRGHDVLEVDMRLLAARLRADAERDGAVLIGGVRAVRGDDRGLVTDAGHIACDAVVDASGLTGARLLDQPSVAASDLCAAAQEVREIADPAGAAEFFARSGVPLGDVCCFSGIAGGYSIVNLRVDEAHGTVSILTGSIPGDGHPSGRALLDRFVAEQPWIGARIFGGARAVPLRRPLEVLAHGRVTAVGDAAFQVFPAHGSGIGPQLVAARVLADELAAGRGVAGYARAWPRRHGGLLAAYDVFRRLSQRFTIGDLEQLMDRGLIDPELSRRGLDQELPRASLASLAGKARALSGAPSLGGRLAVAAGRMAAVTALYAAYPARPRALPTWRRALDLVAGAPA